MTEWHQAYGLSFRNQACSAFSLPFMRSEPPQGGEADIDIRLGPVPARLEGAVTEHGLWSTAPGRFLLRDGPIGGFLARDGRDVIVEPAPGASPAELRMFMTGSVTASLLQQRGIIPFHASGLRIDDGIVLFAGPSGAGKSSLLGEWLRRGYPSVSDDLVGVTVGPHGHPLVRPGYPVIKLWEDVIDQFDRSDETSGTTRVREGLAKHILPVQMFDAAIRRLKAVFVLRGRGADTVEVRRLSGATAFAAIGDITYRARMLPGLGMSATHFATASAILARVPVFSITRGQHGFTVSEMADAVMQCLEEADTEPRSMEAAR